MSSDKKRLNLSFSMASPIQRQAWRTLMDIPAGERTGAVCRGRRAPCAATTRARGSTRSRRTRARRPRRATSSRLLRLSEKGYEVGLISKERYDYVCKKKELIDKEIERVSHVNIGARADVQEILKKYNSIELSNGTTLEELIRRPELSYEAIAPIDPERNELPEDVIDQINISIKYKGYIDRQKEQVNQFKKLENRRIPEDIDYNDVTNLRKEARQKLMLIKPENIGQASRISGVSPADVTVLLIYLKSRK